MNTKSKPSMFQTCLQKLLEPISGVADQKNSKNTALENQFKANNDEPEASHLEASKAVSEKLITQTSEKFSHR